MFKRNDKDARMKSSKLTIMRQEQRQWHQCVSIIDFDQTNVCLLEKKTINIYIKMFQQEVAR